MDSKTRSRYPAVSEEVTAYEAALRGGLDTFDGHEVVGARTGAALVLAVAGELEDTPECVAEVEARLNAVISEGRSPELESLRNLKGGGRGLEGHKDVWHHTLRVICRSGNDTVLRLAALYHDIGKPDTRAFAKGRGVHFDGHEVVGARIVRRIGPRYGWPKELTEAVAVLVRQHLRAHQAQEMTDAGVRRYVRQAGSGGWERLGDLTRADCTSRYAERQQAAVERVDQLEAAIVEVGRRDARAAVRGPIDGYAIMERYGLPPGPEMGRAANAVMKAAQNAWDEGEELTEAEAWKLVAEILGDPAA